MPIPLVTRILVADDHPLVREGVKRVVDHEHDLAVVAEAADGAEAVAGALDPSIDLASSTSACPVRPACRQRASSPAGAPSSAR
jgi:DNA-binding NarL/FixJ family response regulator